MYYLTHIQLTGKLEIGVKRQIGHFEHLYC